MVPKSLAEWNLSVIMDLLTKGYYETEDFDFKEMLPHKSDKAGKQRLLKACCAFANSSGGFLVFGINDDSTLPPKDRMVGIDTAIDFPEHFGNYPLQCEPSIVGWEFLNPPLAVGNGNVIHIVYLPRSWKAPHSMQDLDRPNWRCFPKRTNKGDEEMSYEEIKMAFLQYYEKRLKLQLLRTELDAMRQHASFHLTGDSGEFSLTVLETTLAETYTLLLEQKQLLNVLNQIRASCRRANKSVQTLHTLYYFDQSPMKDARIQNKQNSLNLDRDYIRSSCEDAIRLLEAILAA